MRCKYKNKVRNGDESWKFVAIGNTDRAKKASYDIVKLSHVKSISKQSSEILHDYLCAMVQHSLVTALGFESCSKNLTDHLSVFLGLMEYPITFILI